MADSSATATKPYITANGVAYEIDELSDVAKRHTSDLFKTVQEYRELFKSYKQNLTVTGAYSSSLKQIIEENKLPVVYVSGNEIGDQERATIKVDDTVYDATDLPDAVKVSLQELIQTSNQRSIIEYRLRQLDAARTSFITALQSEIESTSPKPMDPQPETTENS